MSILEETINRLIVVIEEQKRMLESMTNERDELQADCDRWQEACDEEHGRAERMTEERYQLRRDLDAYEREEQ